MPRVRRRRGHNFTFTNDEWAFLNDEPFGPDEATLGQRVDEALTGMIPSAGIAFEAIVEEMERALILRASYATKWNQSRTADMLNMKRDKLRYRMKLYDLHADGQGHPSHPNAQ